MNCAGAMVMVNFLTFDIEDWYHANYQSVDISRFQGVPSRLEAETDRLLEICADAGVESTCFVLGSVAETLPGLVKKIAAAGHEVASHGHSHQLVYSMTPDQFRKDLQKSCAILEELTGKKVWGFRAPSWSLKEDTLEWYYPILEEANLAYSSSVYPASTFLYGIPAFPNRVHYPAIAGRDTTILEIPVPVVRLLGKTIGFSGGFYFRLLPGWLIRKAFRKVGPQGKESFLYLHPREIDPQQARLPLPFLESLIQYYGTSSCEKKLRRTLAYLAGSFVRMGDYARARTQDRLLLRRFSPDSGSGH